MLMTKPRGSEVASLIEMFKAVAGAAADRPIEAAATTTKGSVLKEEGAPVDFHAVEPDHYAIHQRLENWARYVEVRRLRWVNSIWRMGKSHGRQWHAPELRPEVDTRDGHIIEKAVAALPDKHREAIRWSYVYQVSPASMARELAVTYQGLAYLVRSGRTMLKNTA